MSLGVQIHDGPLPAAPWPLAAAVIGFEGVVRPVENEQPIAELRDETYDPMAEKERERLGGEAMDRYIDRMKQLVPSWKHAIPTNQPQETSR